MEGTKLGVFLLFCTLVILCLSTGVSSFRTCAEARYCCPGRNNTCFAFGPRMDRDANETRCFCDQNCVEMQDCCIDYKETCEGADCVVSDWGPWSQCSELCGLGVQRRKRKPIRKRQHGGLECPVLHEKRACVGNDCYAIQSVEYQGRELREVGQIIPARFASWRNSPEYSPKLDIRSNLQDPSNEVPTRLTYCATFKITETRKLCNSSQLDRKWANIMQPGEEVCVQCDPFAMSKELGTRCIGHGVYNEETRWKAVHVPYCNGKWKMISKHEECTCARNPGYDFILV